MKQLIHWLAFLVLTITMTSAYGMKEGSLETAETLPLSDFPNEILLEIIKLASGDKEVKQYSNENAQSVAMLQTIRRITPLMFVCKRFYEVSSIAIKDFLRRVERGMEQLGGKNVVLEHAINNKTEEVARLCLGLGADINAIGYTQGEVVAPVCTAKKPLFDRVFYAEKETFCAANETLLTRAIKEMAYEKVELILKLGNAMQPNAYGDMPIDIAFKRSRALARILKDYGGDQDNRYGYTNNRVWRSVGGEYGRPYGLKRLAQ